jgi:hypothetical protein
MATIRIWNPYNGRGVISKMSHRHHKHHYRRRNPLGVGTGEVMSILTITGGGVVARALPAMVLPAQNTGWMGYLLNAGTAFLMKLLIPGNLGHELFIGGGVGMVMRIVSDNLGAKIQGLSGDPAFTLGAYWQSYFAVPTNSDPYGRVAASPYPQPVLAPAPARGMSGPGPRGGAPTRFSSGRFG